MDTSMISCFFLSCARERADIHVLFYENMHFSTTRAGKAYARRLCFILIILIFLSESSSQQDNHTS